MVNWWIDVTNKIVIVNNNVHFCRFVFTEFAKPSDEFTYWQVCYAQVQEVLHHDVKLWAHVQCLHYCGNRRLMRSKRPEIRRWQNTDSLHWPFIIAIFLLTLTPVFGRRLVMCYDGIHRQVSWMAWQHHYLEFGCRVLCLYFRKELTH